MYFPHRGLAVECESTRHLKVLLVMVLDLQALKLELSPRPFIQDGLMVDVLDPRTHVFRSSRDRLTEILVFFADQTKAVEEW